jgi:hypothetical protein
MVTILEIVTFASLLLTITLIVILVRLLREQRRRSEARVAALAQMAAEDSADTMLQLEPDDLVFDQIEQLPGPDTSYPHAMASADLFAVREERSAWPRRAAVAGSIALLAMAIGLAARAILPSGQPGTADAAPEIQASQQASTGMLELLSLKHAQQGDTLTITGLVQNPRGGMPLSKVAATAFLFSADGTFLASGRAPLDFTILRPGDESGFVITVPVSGTVARYRIGFRSEDGRIIGHVDRRGSVTMALVNNGS